MRFRKIFYCICLTSIFLANCSPAVRLSPSPDARVPSGIPEAAFEDSAGVKILVETESWTGFPAIEEYVTPVRVTVTNSGDEPVRIRYHQFVLEVNSDKFRAQPPYQLQGMIEIPYSKASLFDDTVYHYEDLESDPCCRVLERVLAERDTSYFDDDPPDVWLQLPTKEMLQRVLLDGVVKSGELVSGFLYFEQLRGKPGEVVFTADIVSAVDGELMGVVRIPLKLMRE
ncbi:MAG: hypothetical protein ACLFQB_15740 [Chitinispirillaceae bacterium]